MIVKDARIAGKVQAVFEADWELGKPPKDAAEAPAAAAEAATAAAPPSSTLVSA